MKVVVSGLISEVPQLIRPNADTILRRHASAPPFLPASSLLYFFQSRSASDQRSLPPARPASCPPLAGPTETTEHHQDRSVAAPAPSPPATRHSDSHSLASSETYPPVPKV